MSDEKLPIDIFADIVAKYDFEEIAIGEDPQEKEDHEYRKGYEAGILEVEYDVTATDAWRAGWRDATGDIGMRGAQEELEQIRAEEDIEEFMRWREKLAEVDDVEAWKEWRSEGFDA